MCFVDFPQFSSADCPWDDFTRKSACEHGKSATTCHVGYRLLISGAFQVFKAYSVQTLTEATNFVQDLKLGHYIKVPPRATFTGECYMWSS